MYSSIFGIFFGIFGKVLLGQPAVVLAKEISLEALAILLLSSFGAWFPKISHPRLRINHFLGLLGFLLKGITAPMLWKPVLCDEIWGFWG
jgi:hypothetical protein